MILLTRFNRAQIAINCDLIESVEEVPDTTVRLVSGEKLLVLESVDQVIAKVVEHRRAILSALEPASSLAAGHRPATCWLRAEDNEDEGETP